MGSERATGQKRSEPGVDVPFCVSRVVENKKKARDLARLPGACLVRCLLLFGKALAAVRPGSALEIHRDSTAVMIRRQRDGGEWTGDGERTGGRG